MQFVSVHNCGVTHRPLKKPVSELLSLLIKVTTVCVFHFSTSSQSRNCCWFSAWFFFSPHPGQGEPEVWLCATENSLLSLFVYGDQTVSSEEANAGLSSLRSAPQLFTVLPRPHTAELSAPTAEVLINSETKPHSLGRDCLCLPQFCFFFLSWRLCVGWVEFESLILRPCSPPQRLLSLSLPDMQVVLQWELFNKSVVDSDIG